MCVIENFNTLHSHFLKMNIIESANFSFGPQCITFSKKLIRSAMGVRVKKKKSDVPFYNIVNFKTFQIVRK